MSASQEVCAGEMTLSCEAAVVPEDLMTSREQTSTPEFTNSWLANVNNYNELESDPGLMSQDSIDCLQWAHGGTNGRPESPLQFDHDEVVHIESEVCNVQPMAGCPSDYCWL